MATTGKVQPAERQRAQRLPAPSLFVGPPSRNVSSVSLHPASTNSDAGGYNGRPSLSRQTSLANERAGGRLAGSPSSPATARPENQFASLDANASAAGGMPHSPDERERGGSGGGLPGTGRPVLNRAPSKLQQELQQPLHRAETHRRAGVDAGRPTNPNALIATSSNTPHDPKAGQKQTAEDKTEALWASMQNTLEEVELSASTKNHSVFGPEHAKALEELRTAQIALAHAWGKSEADEAPGSTEQSGLTAGRLKDMEHEHEIGKSDLPHEMHSPSAILNSARRSEHPSKTRARAESTASTATTASERGSNGGLNNSKSILEEETENDIRLARRRREANDRYFDKVSKGVLEVVKKLELVAVSMKNVEMESREIWRDIDREGEEGDQSDKGSDAEDGRGGQK